MTKLRADKATKRELLALPHLPWGEPRGWFDALLIIPGRHKHDSGWAHIAVIGVNHVDGGDEAEHIIAYPDDLHWPAQSGISDYSDFTRSYGSLRTDAYHPSGVLRLWSSEYKFSVDHPTSSVDILIRKKTTK